MRSRMERLLSLVRDSASYGVDEVTGCWVWGRSRNQAGYGLVRIVGVLMAAHRAFYEALNGPIPRGFVLHHLCSNRACLNASHLQLLPAAEHTRLHSAKLTADEVVQIRRDYARGNDTQAGLARSYGVSTATISNIVNGRTWKDVPDADAA